MEDSDPFSDDWIGADAFLELEQDAYEATQREQSGIAQPANAGDEHPDSRPSLQDPSRLLRAPISFGDTDTRSFDAGVLDDGTGPALVEEQHAGFQNGIVQPEHGRFQTGSYMSAEPAARVEHDLAFENTSLQHQQPNLAGYKTTEKDADMAELDAEGTGNGAAYPVDINDMLDQVEQLSRERDRAYQELNSAKSNAEARAGEIAIIRANQAKLEKSHDQQLNALRNAMDEEIKKHQAQIDAALMESKRVTTENQFLKQDLREETLRLNDMQQNRKSKAKADGEPPVTPSKSRNLPLRDGFDDDEIMASPSKSMGKRSKRGTPSAPGKRKRQLMDDSPIAPPLELSQSFEPNLDQAADAVEPMALEAPAKSPRESRNVRFIRKILNHCSYPNKARDLEVFASWTFPSEPERTFSSMILEATTARPSEDYPVEYAKAIIALWSRAVKEKYHTPIGMFMSIIKFILDLDITAIAPLLVVDLVHALHGTGYVNGVPRFTNSPVSSTCYGQFKQTPQKELDHKVDGTEALELLYLTASGCSHDPTALCHFWQSVTYDFILMMLNSYQPTRDIIIVLNLLSCSITPTAFGPILNTEAEQIANENYIIDRAANLLSELPCVDEGCTPCTPWEITTLRLESMAFLLEIAFSAPDPAHNHPGRMLAMHPSALARVFRAMHDELDALYSSPPERELHAALVNGLTRLAYGIMTSFADVVDLPAKLRAVPGAVQKHLVVLTRLAFCEGPVLEAGITDETAEMAHEMLEEAVNPQEAEALSEAFRSRSQD